MQAAYALTLFCLPYAGAGALIYRAWPERLPPSIRVLPLDLPGRGTRHARPPLDDWSMLVDVLLEDVQPHLSRPFAIFGHSMGALIGLELAHAVRARHGKTPVWMGASGCTAPARRVGNLKWRDCPESELLAELRALGGTPDELIENREFLDVLLPIVRADFHLCGSYRAQDREPLDCPLLVMAGADDDLARDPENLRSWAGEVTGPFRLEMVDGGHFFIDSRRDIVIGYVGSALEEAHRAEVVHGR
jgi:surfactin synthase thioesterase subunit